MFCTMSNFASHTSTSSFLLVHCDHMHCTSMKVDFSNFHDLQKCAVTTAVGSIV